MLKTFNHNFVTPPPALVKVDDERGRYYENGDDKYESVTSFISRNWDKTFLVAWRKRIGEEKANKISKAATDRGSALHKALETYLFNQPIDEVLNSPLTKALFYKVKTPLDKLDNIRLIEKPLYSTKLKLAGTPDFIGDYNSKLAVVDFKTSTRAKKKIDITDYFLQAACYAVMYEEHYGIMPELAVIIMATESVPYPQLFIEPMERCVKMLHNFINDPLKFQAILNEAK